MNKKFKLSFLLLLFCIPVLSYSVSAEEPLDADTLLDMAVKTDVLEDKYNLLTEAKDIYKKKYDKNQKDIKVLIGLSKTYQLIGDREEAKNYVIKAYNLKPLEAITQKAMGDFYYNFEEYSTAIEYYNAALASGFLKDFETNLMTAQCYAKIGEIEKADIYYQMCNYIDNEFYYDINTRNDIEDYIKEYYKSKEQPEYAEYYYEDEYEYTDDKVSEPLPENMELKTNLQDTLETEKTDNLEDKTDVQEEEQTPEQLEEEMDNIIQQLNSTIDIQ